MPGRPSVLKLRLLLLSIAAVGIAADLVIAQSVEVPARAIITPSLVHLEPGSRQQFKVIVLASRLMAASAPKSVKWSVNDTEGGDAEYGTISKDGVYRASSKIPKPREVHISAHTDEAQNKTLFATVIIGDSSPQYKSVHTWSRKLDGSDSGSAPLMIEPHGFGLDKMGNLLIADEKAGRVLRFTADGEYLNEVGRGPGEKPGQFMEPREVRSAPNGDIVVTDSKGDQPRMQIFNHEGKLLRMFAEKGRGPGQILRAHGIGFGPEQRLFITDIDNMRVNVYAYSGEFLYDFGNWPPYKDMNPGEMNAPHGMFVDRNSDVFVNSYYGPTQKFTPEGHMLTTFARGDPPEGSVFFHNLTGDKWGNIYLMCRPEGGSQEAIVDGKMEKSISVKKFNNNGDLVTQWSYSNPRHRETTAAVDADGKFYALYMTDKEIVVERFAEE